MKYPTRFVASAFCALALIITAKYIPLNSNVSAQQETEPKFRPAGPNAKNPRADEWEVSFKKSLSIEEVDREIDRILLQYDAKVLPAGIDKDKPARYPRFYAVYIQAPAERAKQIAEDDAVLQVNQVQDTNFQIPQSLEQILESASPPKGKSQEPDGKRPVPGKK